MDHKELFKNINGLDLNDYLMLLVKLMIDRETVPSRMIFVDRNKLEPLYRVFVDLSIKSIIDSFNEISEVAEEYCDYKCRYSEKFDRFKPFHEDFLYISIKEILNTKKSGRDFFSNTSLQQYLIRKF